MQHYQHYHYLLQLHSLSPQTPFPLHYSYHFIFHKQISSNHGCYGLITKLPSQRQRRKRRRIGSNWWVGAIERESKFEVDPDKARQALDELDQQLDSLSTKKVNPPKIRATSLSNMKEKMKEGSSEISGSFITFTTIGLFLFTIFYNILFITVIKPSIDGP